MILRIASLLALAAGSLALQSGNIAAAPDAAAASAAAPAGPMEITTAGFDDAAKALRARDCAGAQTRLAAIAAAPESPATAMARLLRGAYAAACGDAAAAETLLSQAAAPGGPLEDWRLFWLADSADRLGHAPAARAALARLIEDYPASPLRSEAVAKAAAIADRAGDRARARELVALGRREHFDDPTSTRLELLALAEARRSGDRAAQHEAAKRLLVQSPIEAATARAAEAFRDVSGSLDWNAFLTRDEILARSERLIELDIADGAMLTLAAIPAAKRDARWYALEARALTENRRGIEALKLLAGAPLPANGVELAALEWARANAALDAATARRGKNVPSAAARQTYSAEARLHLARVADAGGDPALAQRALKRLFTELGDDGPYEQVVQTLRRLRQLDPKDDTGTRYLFDRGWQEYNRANYTGAVGHWSELVDLYPNSRTARGARYWTGRAFAALGQRERATEILREIADADTTDFYRRHAMVRLADGASIAQPGASAPAATATAPTAAVAPDGGTEPAAVAVREVWPRDPRLERAHALSDLGLDVYATQELDSAGPNADLRAATALRALLLARTGQRRESLRTLRQAFPDLATARQATVPEEALRLYYPLDYAEPVRAVAQAQGLPPGLVFAIIHQESGFDAGAVSHAGARGLMQLMNGTGRELAHRMGLPYTRSKLTDPEFSVRLGTTYFRQLLGMFDGTLELALASYNGGPGRIQRLWRSSGHGDLDTFVESLRPEETKNYVKRILVISDSYRQLYSPSPG